MFKKLLSTVAFGFVSLSGAYAQSDPAIQAKIPFNFTVKGTQMTAGSYRLSYDELSHVLYFRGMGEKTASIYAPVTRTSTFQPLKGPARLIFECNGDNCSLARVWQSSYGEYRSLDIKQKQAQRTLAFATRTVVVTAR